MARQAQAFLKDIGADKGATTLKSDQQPAISTLLNEVSRRRAAEGGGRIVAEHSAVGDSQVNGLIEPVMKSMEGQLRVARSALERWIWARIDLEHVAVTWLAEYTSMLSNRYEVGRDGKSAHERCKDKSLRLMGLEFGESVM